jgi:hypothetical protein
VALAERDEIHADEIHFQLGLLIVDFHVPQTSAVSPHDLVDGHELIAAQNKLLIVIRMAFNPENRIVAGVTVSQGPILLPIKNLDRECLVHSDGDQLLAILGEYHVKDTSEVGGLHGH